jgi:hypothetical protein
VLELLRHPLLFGDQRLRLRRLGERVGSGHKTEGGKEKKEEGEIGRSGGRERGGQGKSGLGA